MLICFSLFWGISNHFREKKYKPKSLFKKIVTKTGFLTESLTWCHNFHLLKICLSIEKHIECEENFITNNLIPISCAKILFFLSPWMYSLCETTTTLELVTCPRIAYVVLVLFLGWGTSEQTPYFSVTSVLRIIHCQFRSLLNLYLI